ncbi:hypothetical protein [Mobiluncus mulieris]|uniref:Uncharacterized protein n=1 Tax=Mobiluncus mulieris TaxID=2052 RepID=A0A7Y0UVC1_9ACTO|nr:hypothetical protein [Mobiluncus mulieris]NMX04446.1 hypothetical protein [Mobiluncus mulieris]NMX12534.1 hypothetical protein [Mobiluncus mulieris]
MGQATILETRPEGATESQETARGLNEEAVDAAIQAAEAELDAGDKARPAREVLSKLREKHFG